MKIASLNTTRLYFPKYRFHVGGVLLNIEGLIPEMGVPQTYGFDLVAAANIFVGYLKWFCLVLKAFMSFYKAN